MHRRLCLFASLLTLWGCDRPPTSTEASPEPSREAQAAPEASPGPSPEARPPEAAATPSCEGTTAAALADCVDRASYIADVTALSAAPRPPGSPGWRAAVERCATRLTSLGYEVTRQSYGTGVNVIGRKRGTEVGAGVIVVGAHLDHIEGCPGADDNASGVAGALELARVLRDSPLRHTLEVACWDEEENGFHGSGAHAEALVQRGAEVRVALIFEMIGYRDRREGTQRLPAGFDQVFPEETARLVAAGSRGDSLVVISDAGARVAAEGLRAGGREVSLPVYVFEASEALKTAPGARDLRRSDHKPFWERGIPALMVTDTANFRNPHYHCRDGGRDTVDTLDHDFARQSIQAMVHAVIAADAAP